MKKVFFISVIIAGYALTSLQAQDIPQAQVPSLIVHQFQKDFPKASDIEWKLKGELYKVEFETGFFGTDHDAWYDKTGKLVKHKEEISKSDLPTVIQDKITATFAGFRIDDVEKITENRVVTYLVELKNSGEEWKVLFNTQGEVLQKVAD